MKPWKSSFVAAAATAAALLALAVSPLCRAADAPAPADKPAAAEKPDASKMPHINIDVKKKQVRVDAEFVNPQMPLEFFICMSGTAEHEAVLRSAVKPSHIHLGLLMLGLKPGEPVRFSRAADKWLPPAGPPLHMFAEWVDKKGQTVRYPAYRLMRNVKTKKEMPPMTWVFCGSRFMDDGKYAADTTGYIVSVVNFDLTLIDIPEIASNSNETLEWEINPDLCPPKGTQATIIIEAAGGGAEKAAGDDTPRTTTSGGATTAGAQPAAAAETPGPRLSEVQIDEARVKKLRAEWEHIVRPHNKALREAAQKHYEVMNALRREQNRLIDEADRIQRVIDQLQKEYQDMTTPQPEREEGETPKKSEG